MIDALPVVGMHVLDVRLEGAVELEGVDAVDAVELVAPLHGARRDVPQPSTDVRERLAFAESRFGFAEHPLRESLLGDVLHDRDGPDAPAAVQNRAQRQRRHHAGLVAAFDLGVVSVDAVTGGNCVEQRAQPREQRIGKERVPLRADDLLEVVPEHANRGAVPRRDAVRGVDAEHRVSGGVDECVEDGEPHRDAARQFLRCWCLAPGRLRECHVTPSSPSWQRIARRPFHARPPRLVGTMTVARLDPDAGADLAGAALAVARRFAAGATMWCLAPEWPEHAHHVAVEFVHPVIMGTRALPAIAVTDDDPVAAIRATARPGDILCAVSSTTSALVRAAMQRARVWGLTTVWVGAGPERPEPGSADHVLWIDGEAGAAAHDGSIVLRYHLLWELTHVCFEHPGLLAEVDDACALDSTCVTCSDEGRVVEVMTVDSAGLAMVRSERGTESIDVNLVVPVVPGDLVLVHAGTAIGCVPDAGVEGVRR